MSSGQLSGLRRQALRHPDAIRRRGAVAFLVAIALAGPGPTPAAAEATNGPSASAARSCRDAFYYSDGYLYARTRGLRATRLGCRRARRVARYYLRNAEGTKEPVRPYGFRCRNTGVRVVCRKGSRRVRWRW